MTTAASNGSVIVVGGGVVGLACAHYLRQLDLQITVIERGAIGGACSLGNCGYICPSHVLPLTEPAAIRVALKSMFQPASPFRVKPTLSPTMWRWMLEFGRRCTHRRMMQSAVHLHAILQSSMSEYRQLTEAGHLECEWKPLGLLYAMRSQQAMDEFASTDRLLTEHFDISARRIEGQDLPEFDSALRTDLAGAYYYEHDAHLNPGTLTSAWAARLRGQEVRLVEDCELQDVETDRRRVTRLRTSQGEMSAETVVIATGAWSPSFSKSLECPIPIQPGKGYSVTTARPDPCPRHPILFPEHRVGVTPFESGFRIGSMMEFVGYDETIPPRRIEQLFAAADHYLVGSASRADVSEWYGWRPMTWDSLPIIGRTPRLSNVLLATGHNMLGVSLATATGKLIAEIVADKPTHLNIAPYSPARFSRSTR
ncbi:NAD(P)/FAD-dependent oxidoreductase [Aeoliella sp.]|uniref:NAD(P)/FAD-dependent oxidoreductase n=1 Tax=Aeoliella sp. TaxID=2795800 RepID=UPI003CCBFEF6